MRLKEPLLTMRPDMGKCVIERPRRGSATALSAKARHYGKIVEYDDGPDYEGLTRLPVSSKQEGYNKKLGDKDFTDVLGPLHRYLRSSCGRLWNDVYSEVKWTLGNAGWGVRHIISAHVDVAIHTYRGADGNVWVSDKHGVHQAGGLYYDFHVEPESGILREGTQYRKWRSVTREKEKTKPLEFVPIEDGKEYRKIAGIWYLHEFQEVEVKTPVFLRGSLFRVHSETRIISKSKRQLGKKQLKELGLRNGPLL
jgi:hypothetical protein